MTVEEWQFMIVAFTSQEFKEVLDEMTYEEIMDVWQCFEPWMTAKFLDGLTRKDVQEFTLSEWRASFTLPASEFKKRFVDHMTSDEILEVFELFDDEDIDDFLFDLSEYDWRTMTKAEYDVFFAAMTEKDQIIEFVNQMLKVDYKIVSLILMEVHQR